VQFGQSLGLDRYRRTFVRLDTGRLGGAGTRLALSGSLTDADKWKGPGELGPRENASVMLTQPIGARDTVAVWLNLSELDQHLYRPLSYAQVQDLDANRDLDYNGRLTGDRAVDILHYDHNRGRYRNRDLLARVPVTLGDRWRLTVTPYWSREDTGIRGGAPRGGGVIRVRSRDITRQGVTARLDTDLGWARATLGTWHEALDMDIGIASVHPVTGALLGRSVGVESDDDATSAAPYLRLAGEYGGLSWQAGLKYFAFREPRSEGTVFPPPDFQPEPAADLVRSARTYDAWLPTVGLSRRLGPGATLVASYGRGQIRPYAYLPLINLYNGNRAAFQAAGVTLDDLFAGYAMETSDTVELGARLRLGRLTARPTVYRATHDNLLTTVSDPRVDLSYFQNVGQATGTGVELEATYDLADAVTLFCNPAWVRLTYDQDLTFQGNTLAAEGNQVVATPEWTVQAGALMRWGALELTPRLRYLGERFGDVEHRERIDAALVADLRAAYTLRDVAGGHRLRVTLEVINLLDTGYVAVIDASDDDRAGEASYHVGAPATALVSLALGF
jgi:iron complex outermembrane receptor protein